MAQFDTDAIKASNDIYSVISSYMGDLKPDGREFRGLCPFHSEKTPSFTVSPDIGRYHCFGCGANGNVIDFVTSYCQISFREACEALNGQKIVNGERFKPVERSMEKFDYYKDYTPKPTKNKITPKKPIDLCNPKQDGKIWKGCKPVMVHKYADGMYVLRIEIDGKKQTPMVRWCAGPNGWEGWTRYSFGDESRPMYGDFKPGKQVIMVEGEKAADAAIAVLDGKVCVATWAGGGNSVLKTDYSALAGANVILWPDADEPGFGTMRTLAEHLKTLNCNVSYIDPGKDKPKGWDCADTKWAGSQGLIDFCKQHKVEVLREWENPPDPEPENDPPRQDIPVDAYVEDFSEPVQASPEPPKRNTPDGNDPHDTVRPLGYDRGKFFYWSASQKQIISLSASTHTKLSMLQMAPLSWWEDTFPAKNGCDWDNAASVLMRQCERQGIFQASKVRGRGCWLDNGEMVIHLGDRVAVKNATIPLDQFKSKFIYEAAAPVDGPHTNPLGDNESRQLIEIAKRFSWEMQASAALLCGWVVLAPLCGALKWRPHVWLTGGTGTGKSTILDDFIKPLTSGAALYVQGNSSEAGIRQTLKSDAMPVLFDESEQNNEAEERRIQGVLALMRQSSSDGQARTVKGTASGSAMDFLVRSMFCLASIQVGIKQQADYTRISVLALKKSCDVSAWEQTKDMLFDINSQADFGSRLVRRTIDNFLNIQKNIQLFIRVAAHRFRSQRLGDQYGTLLAGCYSLVSTGVATEERARDFINKFEWDTYIDDANEDESVQALNSILQIVVRVDCDHGSLSLSLGELVQVSCSQIEVSGVTADTAEKTLCRMGLKTDMLIAEDSPTKRSMEVLHVANRSDPLQSSLKDKPWRVDWRNYLKRIEGAITTKKTYRFGAIVCKATTIPINSIFMRG